MRKVGTACRVAAQGEGGCPAKRPLGWEEDAVADELERRVTGILDRYQKGVSRLGTRSDVEVRSIVLLQENPPGGKSGEIGAHAVERHASLEDAASCADSHTAVLPVTMKEHGEVRMPLPLQRSVGPGDFFRKGDVHGQFR